MDLWKKSRNGLWKFIKRTFGVSVQTSFWNTCSPPESDFFHAPANPAMQQPPVENGFDDMGFSPMDESEDDLPF